MRTTGSSESNPDLVWTFLYTCTSPFFRSMGVAREQLERLYCQTDILQSYRDLTHSFKLFLPKYVAHKVTQVKKHIVTTHFAIIMKTTIAFLALTVVGCSALSNPVIKTMAQGMSLLKPVFSVEAKLQAAVLGANVDETIVSSEIEALTKKNKVLIYTYGLSPFSSEAVALLDASGFEYTKIELGAEWFLLGPEASVKRVALSKMVENGATSLPKVFIGGKCIGGCSELATLTDNGELSLLMSQAKVSKKGQGKKSFFQ